MGAKNHQLSDPALAPFLAPSFDAADYLNAALSPLQTSSQTLASTSLSSLSAETQSLLATLNAQATRLTDALTLLTDEILRTGSRLAYQVDVLRSESLALSDILSDRLQDDIQVFTASKTIAGEDATATTDMDADGLAFQPRLTPDEPAQLSRLRLLVFVKDRLDLVIRVFGAAIAWPAPPVASTSFISVSAPPTSDADRRAKEFAESLRAEITELLDAEDESAARAKVDEFRTLLDVWKGTAEERGREKFVAELIRLVENRQAGRRASEEDDSQAYLAGMYT